MARDTVLRRQKQSSRGLKPNWISVWWRRVFGINMTSRQVAVETSQAFFQSGEEGEGTWTCTLGCIYVKLHLRHKQTNTQRDKRTDSRNRIWCIFALKCDIWWKYLDDFPYNQLTKVRVSIDWSRIFIPSPLNFYEASRFDHPYDGLPWQTQRTDKQTNRSVSL